MNIKYPDTYNVYFANIKKGPNKWAPYYQPAENKEIAIEKFKLRFGEKFKNLSPKIMSIIEFRNKQAKIQKEYYYKNPRKYIAHVIKWQNKNPDKRKIHSDTYRRINKDEISKRAYNRYHLNPEIRKKQIEYNKKYLNEHPEVKKRRYKQAAELKKKRYHSDPIYKEKKLKQSNAFYQSHKEYFKEYQKQYRMKKKLENKKTIFN